MRPPQGFEWLVILVIVLLLFGGKRLPDMARGLGRSLRILKAESRGLADDGTQADDDEAATASGAAPAALPEGGSRGAPTAADAAGTADPAKPRPTTG